MHTFSGHSKAVTGMQQSSHNENYIVSGGLDGVIKIWDLERMIEIYSFEVHTNSDEGAVDELYKLQLINDRLYAIFTKGHQNSIEIGQIPHLVNSFFISKPVI